MADYEELVKRLRYYEEHGLRAIDPYEAGEAADAIEELHRENESYANTINEASEILRNRLKSKWISVEERLPIRGDRVLVTNGGFVCEAYLSTADNWIRGGTPLFYMTPTHWMPLPEPPAKEEK